MAYRLITDLVVVLHFLWILFLLFGFCFVLKGSRIAYVHAAGLLFSLVLNLMGWYCPLTYIEDHLNPRLRAPVAKSFVVRTIEKLVYPDIDEALIRNGEIGFVILNGMAYGWALKRKTSGTQRKP